MKTKLPATNVSRPISKLAFVATTATLLVAQASFADRSGGGGVGNGGGSWTCRADTPAQELVWAELVDLSEGRREQGLDIPVTGPMQGAIPTPLAWVTAGNRYLTWAESKINLANPDFYAEYMRRKTDLLNHRILMPSESDFYGTTDIFNEPVVHHTRPDESSCQFGTIPQDPEQLANFTRSGQLLINVKLWNSPLLSEIDRAALFVHEIMYWIFRDIAHDTDSLRTRQIVGFLFASTKPVEQYRSMITLIPQQAAAPDLPLLYGMYAESTGHYTDIEILSYDTASHILALVQRDRDSDWVVRSQATFHCEAYGSEQRCVMLSSTRNGTTLWDRTLRIIDPTHFMWIKLRRNGSIHHATLYNKLR